MKQIFGLMSALTLLAGTVSSADNLGPGFVCGSTSDDSVMVYVLEGETSEILNGEMKGFIRVDVKDPSSGAYMSAGTKRAKIEKTRVGLVAELEESITISGVTSSKGFVLVNPDLIGEGTGYDGDGTDCGGNSCLKLEASDSETLLSCDYVKEVQTVQ